MHLFRPVGRDELRLIYEEGLKAFPPRLPDQPIFYPVLTESYAHQIAREWNTVSRSKAGFVTHFEVDDAFASRYEPHVVGGRDHVELWVPAEELAEFNRHLQAPIRLLAAYFGEGYEGIVPSASALQGRSLDDQLRALAGLLDSSSEGFFHEIAVNHVAVFVNFPYWEQAGDRSEGLEGADRERVLAAIHERWKTCFPQVRLGLSERWTFVQPSP